MDRKMFLSFCRVSIFIKRNLNFKLIDEHKSNDGRKLTLNVDIDNDMYTLLSIYAPNDEKFRKKS